MLSFYVIALHYITFFLSNVHLLDFKEGGPNRVLPYDSKQNRR